MNGFILVVGLSVALALAGSAVVLGPPMLREMRARQILAIGVTAEARVTDLKDTGNRFNDQPEITIKLEVIAKDRPVFSAQVIRVLSVADAGLFARGKVITVKYDPAHTNRVAIVSAE